MATEQKEIIKGFEDESKDIQKQHTIKKLSTKKSSTEGDKSSTKKNSPVNEYSNILYISRLPKGFHEKELTKYFSQFGDLKQVKLARNKKTGNSRHYGFIEFMNKDDTKIAQETMNNYLLMGHLLKVEILRNSEESEAQISKLRKYKKLVYKNDQIKKDSKTLKKASKAKHVERLSALKENGIDFKF